MDRAEVSLPGFRYFPPQSPAPHAHSRYPALLDRPTPSPERPPAHSSLPDLLATPAAEALAPAHSSLPAVPAPPAGAELAAAGTEAASEPAAAKPPQHGAKSVEEMIAEMNKARGGALTAKAKKGAQKALQKKPAAAKGKKPAAAQGKRTKRSIEVERSVKHVLARTGADTTPKSKSFKYEKNSEVPKAKAAAERWLKSMGV